MRLRQGWIIRMTVVEVNTGKSALFYMCTYSLHGRMIVCIVGCLQCRTRQNVKRKTINGVAMGSLAPVDPVHEFMRERKWYLILTPYR